MTKAERHESEGRALLRRLLSERNQYPDRAASIDEEIREAFQRRVAVLVLDMCGFSRLTMKYGIIPYLAMIETMDTAARPAVAHNRGIVIKQEADNLFATFENPADALEASLDIFHAFDAINSVVPDDRDIHGSIGIGFGEILVIGDEDMFGNEMNLASKLGEDLAQQGEILMTNAAFEALPSGLYECASTSFTISDLDLACFRFERRAR